MVDSLDGGATDVPILGPICRFQNIFRIENQTVINRDMATFVKQVQILHESFFSNRLTRNFTDRKVIVIVKILFTFGQPTVQKGPMKNPPSRESTELGLMSPQERSLGFEFDC